MAAFIVAITGGVASGKSTVGRLFEALGRTLVDADVAARQVVEPGQPALAEIIERFGERMLGEDRRLDRAALRQRVFADEQARQDLEAILHPRIRNRLSEDCLAANGPYVLVAIPLLAEVGGRAAYPWLQRILVVDAPERAQRERLMRRDGIDAALAERMLAAQASRTQRLALADDVIINDGDEPELAGIVATLDARYLRLAR